MLFTDTIFVPSKVYTTKFSQKSNVLLKYSIQYEPQLNSTVSYLCILSFFFKKLQRRKVREALVYR